MERCVFPRNTKPLVLGHSPSSLKGFSNRLLSRRISLKNRKPLIVIAAHCKFSGLNTPLDPSSPAGLTLSTVLQNQRDQFHVAVAEQLHQLAAERDGATARMNLSLDSSDSCLHRRIAKLKENECQIAVEDIIYMLIIFKFSEIRVPLVPKLSDCICYGRLEIHPSKHWQLESIHSFEVLQIIKEYLTAVSGCRADSCVTDEWATTQIHQAHLGQVYAASILYGYFLKSASLRHQLDLCLTQVHRNHLALIKLPELWSCGSTNLVLGSVISPRSTSVGHRPSQPWKNCEETLRCYVMGLDPESLQRLAKVKTKEAVNLVEKHCLALFGDEKTGTIDSNVIITTSFSSLKRMILEAVAFGSFLWDAEEYVDDVYMLKENSL